MLVWGSYEIRMLWYRTILTDTVSTSQATYMQREMEDREL